MILSSCLSVRLSAFFFLLFIVFEMQCEAISPFPLQLCAAYIIITHIYIFIYLCVLCCEAGGAGRGVRTERMKDEKKTEEKLRRENNNN